MSAYDPRIDKLISSAAHAHASGQLDVASGFARQALALDSKSVQAKLLLGVIAAKKGQFAQAYPHLKEVALEDASSFHARVWLSRVCLNLRLLNESILAAREAVALNPSDITAPMQLAHCLLEAGLFREAISTYKGVVPSGPHAAALSAGLGKALLGLNDLPGAIRELTKAVKLDPRMEATALSLGEALLESGEPVRAEEHARSLVASSPHSAFAHILLARALTDQGKGDAAKEFGRIALELAPTKAGLLATYGVLLQSLGEVAEAGTKFEEAIALDPHQAYGYFCLVHNRKVVSDDLALVSAMEELEADPQLPAKQKEYLAYGLGKAKQDLGEFQLAMSHFDEANRLAYRSRFGTASFEAKRYRERLDVVKNLFNASFLKRYESIGIESRLPIFVVGMMRSGTTLVEQILSSHSKVGPAGEKVFWMNHRSVVLSGTGLDASKVSEVAREYVAHLSEIAPGKERVVDKLPMNYILLGLLRLALPNAKVIHVQRHPVDTCLSIYTTPNRTKIEWCNDKGNIVYAYREYLRLMEHWSAVLPSDFVYTVRYEDLVLDQEGATRRMIDFCGLEWEDGCLAPEKNERSVLTPSVWQVRQPVYKNSLERWRNYEPWLGEFRELLNL